MTTTEPKPDETSEAAGIYVAPTNDFLVFWKRFSPEKRAQYIAMTADLILVDPDYIANPPTIVLTRDQWIAELEMASEIALKLKG